jgi:glycosyltransferase involved in cell wall biosynthesis
MRIGIYVEAAKGQLRGVGYHIQQLVYALGRLDSENEYLLYYQNDLFHENDAFHYCPRQPNFQLRPVPFPKNWINSFPTLWWEYVLPLVVKKDRIDIFHSPNFFLPTLRKQKSIVTIHDLAFMKMELYPKGITEALRYWTDKALQSATRIIALSENTRIDIQALGIDSARVRVIYGGGHIVPQEEIQHERMEEVRAAFNLPEKYILFVGVLYPRKNIPFLIRSYAKLKRETNCPHGLVLAGIKGPATEEIEALIGEFGLTSDVTLTGYVEDWQLPLLYKNADLFVLPTLYEGFTLVTLEAMSYGVPVVATDCSSIREGVGEAATLVRSNDVDDMTNAIYNLLVDDLLRQQRIVLGKEQAKKFTWDRCARETLSVYQEVYESS